MGAPAARGIERTHRAPAAPPPPPAETPAGGAAARSRGLPQAPAPAPPSAARPPGVLSSSSSGGGRRGSGGGEGEARRGGWRRRLVAARGLIGWRLFLVDGDFRGAVLNFWFARRRCALCLVWLPPVSLREFCSVQDASTYIFVFFINYPFDESTWQD